MGAAVGIDLGTTNSVVAVADGTTVRVLSDRDGRKLIPSVVSFLPDGTIQVGYEARNRRLVDAANTVYSIKRLIGRPFGSPEVQRARQHFAFALEPGHDNSVRVKVRGGSFALPEISAMVLRKVREVAEEALEDACDRAVITVPANFNELQRSATQAAAKIAGIEALRILNEPTAATLAYGLAKEGAERVAVYDLGGGTFDFTLLDLQGDLFEVVSTSGDTFLGGDDIDLAIAHEMADLCLKQHGYDLRSDPQAFERLRAAAEWAKCKLSTQDSVEVFIEGLFKNRGKDVDFSFELTRSELDALARPIIASTLEIVSDALRRVGRRPREVDAVVLVGGSTRMPLVQSMVEEFFKRSPHFEIDPDLVVAQGAAIHAFAISGEQPRFKKAIGRVKLKRLERPAFSVKGQELREEIPRQPAFAIDPPLRVVEEQGPSLRRARKRTEQPKASGSDLPSVQVNSALSSVPEPRGFSAQPPGIYSHPPPVFALDDPFMGNAELPSTGEEGVPFSATTDWTSHEAHGGDDAGLEPLSAEPTAIHHMPFNEGGGEAFSPPLEFPAPPPDSTPEAQEGDESDADLEGALPMKGGSLPLLMDVTPFTLSVETAGGFCQPIISCNAPIPTERSRVFATAQDDQTEIELRICQGESNRFEENQFLGSLFIGPLRPAERGRVRIEVSFSIDQNGILEVRAIDLDAQREYSTRIRLLGGMSEEEIASMRKRQEELFGRT
ncbi:MAG: Hsp70 family protein [Sandaracinaceae bacterium]|nr:Hsp70 family protein [Sandaracinaceae bacterium]